MPMATLLYITTTTYYLPKNIRNYYDTQIHKTIIVFVFFIKRFSEPPWMVLNLPYQPTAEIPKEKKTNV